MNFRSSRGILKRFMFVVLLSALVVVGDPSRPAIGQEKPAKTTDTRTVDDWVKVLRGKDVAARRSATAALARLAPESKPELVRLVVPALKDEDVDVRQLAAYVLGNARAEPKRTIPALMDALKDQSSTVRRSASVALVQMASVAKDDMIAPLLEELKNDDADVRLLALYILENIDPSPKLVTAALTAASRDGNEGVRKQAQKALKKIAGDIRADEKVLSFSLKFEIKPKSSSDKTQLISLVPMDVVDRQKIMKLTYSHVPKKEFIENGSKYAEFEFHKLAAPVVVEVRVEAAFFTFDFSTASSRTRKIAADADMMPWLADETNLEKNSPEVQEAARKIAGRNDVDSAREIMNFVTKTFEYKGYNPKDVGASKALRARGGDCSEFSDTFVTLCRAKAIPARICEGYLMHEARKGDTPKHNWTEVFFKDHGWVPFDPLHIHNNSATFEKMRSTYLYLGHNRNDKVLKNGHFYHYTYWGQEVDVKDSFLIHK